MKDDWPARFVMLMLSGLATMAVLFAVEATLRGPGEGPSRVGVPAAAPDPVPDQSASPGAVATPSLSVATGVRDSTRGSVMAAVTGSGPPTFAAPAERIEPWLRAIAYALLALAAIGGAMLVVLIRIAGLLARRHVQ